MESNKTIRIRKLKIIPPAIIIYIDDKINIIELTILL